MSRPTAQARSDHLRAQGSPLHFTRNVLLWLLPVTVLWLALTPAYNRFLLGRAESLLHLVDWPNVTDLLPSGEDNAYVSRRDFPPARAPVRQFRVSDAHFHLILVAALFLAVPRLPWRERVGNLCVALLATVVFDVLLLVVQVKALYVARLGDWSLARYGPLARNVWGLAGHLLDLPFKLGLPLLLWARFYLQYVLGWRHRTR